MKYVYGSLLFIIAGLLSYDVYCRTKIAKVEKDSAHSTLTSSPPESSGRFQLVQLGSFRRDQFLIDTATGKLWVKACAYGNKGPDCELSVWQSESIIDLNTTYSDVAEMVANLESRKAKKKQ